jgi:hypothetical protein
MRLQKAKKTIFLILYWSDEHLIHNTFIISPGSSGTVTSKPTKNNIEKFVNEKDFEKK